MSPAGLPIGLEISLAPEVAKPGEKDARHAADSGIVEPGHVIEAQARDILLELHKLNRIPERVVASADDGVGIYITSGKKYAMIECYNDDGIVIGVSDREGAIRNWEITPESQIIRTGLQEALAFLDG